MTHLPHWYNNSLQIEMLGINLQIVSFSCTFQTDNHCLHKLLSKYQTGFDLVRKMSLLPNEHEVLTNSNMTRKCVCEREDGVKFE